MINIGAAGAIPPRQLGEYVVGERAVRDNGSTANLATPDIEVQSDPAMTEALWRVVGQTALGVSRGDAWSVGNMYYTWERLEQLQKEQKYALQCVETEMDGLLTVTGWLNHNYAGRMGELRVGNLFYMSDQLPDDRSGQWQDTMNDLALNRGHKVQVLT